nr:hypothetical protein [Tanacetum cinerariifolium]
MNEIHVIAHSLVRVKQSRGLTVGSDENFNLDVNASAYTIAGNYISKNPRGDKEVVICLGLRFVLEALRFVFKDLAFCLGSTAFCLQRSCVLLWKHCVLSTLKILRFSLEEMRFVHYKDLVFCTDCVLSDNGSYKPTTVLIQAVAATDDSPIIPEHTTVKTPMNMSPENKAHFQAEKEAIHLILTGIGDEIYSTVDACQIAQEMWEAIKRENVGSPVVQQSGIQCFNCKEFGHFAKECRKPKGLKTPCITRKRCCCANKLSNMTDTDEEIDEQELEAHYSYMEKIQEVPTADSGTNSEPLEHVQNDTGYNVFANDLQHSVQSEYVSNTCLVETDDSNVIPDSPDMCNDDIHNDQNDVESDDERVVLANLKLDVDENKK